MSYLYSMIAESISSKLNVENKIGSKMRMQKGGARVCPKCGCDELLQADCKDDKPMLGGYTVKCVACEWEGYSLQLAKKQVEVDTATQNLVDAVTTQAWKSYRPERE